MIGTKFYSNEVKVIENYADFFKFDANLNAMQIRTLHLSLLLFAFVLYTIPLCQCAEMMKAKETPSCCSASNMVESGTQKDCTDATGCCADGINAEKMKTEKSFESAKVSFSPSVFTAIVKFPLLFSVSSQLPLLNHVRLAYFPTDQAFLQVFLI